MNARTRQRGVTLTELLVVGGVLIVLIAVVFAIGSYRRALARRNMPAMQMRGIHQGMVTWSQTSRWVTATGPYPGLTIDREIDARDIRLVQTGSATFTSARTGAYPAYRYAILLTGGYFTPDWAIHPEDAGVKTPVQPGKEVTPANFSFAMLRLDTRARKAEWQETINHAAPVLSDRMIGTIASPQSVWTEPGEGEWAGHVIYNDGVAEWIDTRELDSAPGPRGPFVHDVRVGGGAVVRADHLFIPDEMDADGNTGTNAAMVYATDRDHENQR